MQGLIVLMILMTSVFCQNEYPIMGLNHVKDNFIVLGSQFLAQIDIEQQKVTQISRINRIESSVFSFNYHDYQFIVTSDAQLIQMANIQQVGSQRIIDRNKFDEVQNQKIVFVVFDSENDKLVISTNLNDVLVYDLIQLYNDGQDVIIGTRLVQRVGIKGDSIRSMVKFSEYLVVGQEDMIRVIHLKQESVIHKWNYLISNDKEYKYSDIQQIKHLGLSYLIIGYKNGRIIIVDAFSQIIKFHILNEVPFDVFQILMTDNDEFYVVVATQNGYVNVFEVQYDWFTEQACRKQIKHSIRQKTKPGIKMIEAVSHQQGTNLILGYMNSQYRNALIEGLYIQQIQNEVNHDQENIKTDL